MGVTLVNVSLRLDYIWAQVPQHL